MNAKTCLGSFLLAVVLLAGAASAQDDGKHGAETVAPAGGITLDLIMSDPEWIARSPEGPYFLDDPRAIYWRQKDEGSEERSLFVTRLEGVLDGQPAVHEKVPIEKLYLAELRGGDVSPDGLYRVTARGGDIFVINRRSGDVAQITATSEGEGSPRFLYDASSRPRRIVYTRGGQWLVRDLDTGSERQLPAIKIGKKADEEDKAPEGLGAGEDRLFESVREGRARRAERREQGEARRKADPTRVPDDVYVAPEGEIFETHPSPNGEWMFVTFGVRGKPGKGDLMPVFVNETGYVESRSVRPKVGTGTRSSQKAALVRLSDGAVVPIDVTGLSMMGDDPLTFLKQPAEEDEADEKKAEEKEAEEKEAEEAKPEAEDQAKREEPPKPPEEAGETERGEAGAGPEGRGERRRKDVAREVRFSRVAFSHDGSRLAFQVFSADNKDRWICTISMASLGDSPEAAVPVEVEHIRDEAWVNGRFSEMEWVDKSHKLWFLSEKSGFSHLYLHDAESATTTSLTSGEFEVFDVESDELGRHLYFHSNEQDPGKTSCYRVALETGEVERLIDMVGQNRASLSPDGSLLVFAHSGMLTPPELYVQRAAPGSPPIPLTSTVSSEFREAGWQTPEIVRVPAAGGEVPARIYRPQGEQGRARPAVLFVHGAGYLQNAHYGWSQYFREMMFNQMLAREGFVVLDMDYRASSGYGRDWRTAIYRDMGHCEIEDLKACVDYLAQNENVDRARVGVYGGSYGGFLTLMAMFKEPGLFRAGAALRPVTDWAHYNDGYTANILNTPEIDPEAYKRSSPIEFADGFDGSKGALLICHGMVDDNVLFQDTVRLAQRLIELKKTNWDVAFYPVESHAFERPSSWYDEYRRIYELFTRELRSDGP